MISGLWLGIILGFAVITDFTVQKSNFQGIDWKPDALKPKVEEFVFDRIEQIGYDMYLPVPDTIYMVTKNKNHGNN